MAENNMDNHFRLGGDCITKIHKAVQDSKCDRCGKYLAASDQPLVLLYPSIKNGSLMLGTWKWDEAQCMFADLIEKAEFQPISQNKEI